MPKPSWSPVIWLFDSIPASLLRGRMGP